MRIVISQRGVSIDGEAVTGADAQALIPPRPPAPPARARKDIPDGVITVVAMGCAMVVAVSLGSPLVRAFTRWLDRRSEVARPSDDVVQRLAAIEQAVELVAVEVERISEGQRFTAKLLADRASQDLERVR